MNISIGIDTEGDQILADAVALRMGWTPDSKETVAVFVANQIAQWLQDQAKAFMIDGLLEGETQAYVGASPEERLAAAKALGDAAREARERAESAVPSESFVVNAVGG